MVNLTLALDDAVLRRARVRAVNEGTSVNAVVREFITNFADQSGRWRDAVAEVVRIADQAAATSGPPGRTWTREDLHDRSGLR